MGALLNKRKKRKLENFLFPVIAIILGISMAMPFVFMIIASLKPQAMIMEEPLKLDLANIFWGNYEAVFQHKYFFRWYLNSIAVVAAVLICRGFIVTLAAYAFARLEFRFKNVIFMMVLSMMMIPSDTTLIGRYLFFKGIHLIDTPFVVILPAIFDVFTLFLMRQFFMQIPGDLTEAALIDGCSHFRIYCRLFCLCLNHRFLPWAYLPLSGTGMITPTPLFLSIPSRNNCLRWACSIFSSRGARVPPYSLQGRQWPFYRLFCCLRSHRNILSRELLQAVSKDNSSFTNNE